MTTGNEELVEQLHRQIATLTTINRRHEDTLRLYAHQRDKAEAKAEKLKAEPERLREALRRIRGYTSEHGGAAKALKEIRSALGE